MYDMAIFKCLCTFYSQRSSVIYTLDFSCMVGLPSKISKVQLEDKKHP